MNVSGGDVDKSVYRVETRDSDRDTESSSSRSTEGDISKSQGFGRAAHIETTHTQPVTQHDYRTIYGTAERTGGISMRDIPVIGRLIGLRDAIGRSISRYTAQYVLPSSRDPIQDDKVAYGTNVGQAILTARTGFADFRRQPVRTSPTRQVDTVMFTQGNGGALPPGLGQKKVMLYLNSNAELMLDHLQSPNIGPLKMAKDLGIDVMVCDYGGVGRSEGTPSTKGMTQDVNGLIDYLVRQKGYRPEDIVVFGRSIGGGAALTGTEAYLRDHPEGASPVVGVDRSFSSLFHVTKYSPAVGENIRFLPTSFVARVGKWLGAELNSVRAVRSLRNRGTPIFSATHSKDRVMPRRAALAARTNAEDITNIELTRTDRPAIQIPMNALRLDAMKSTNSAFFVQIGTAPPVSVISGTAKIMDGKFEADRSVTEGNDEQNSSGYTSLLSQFSQTKVADISVPLDQVKLILEESRPLEDISSSMQDDRNYYVLKDDIYHLIQKDSQGRVIFVNNGEEVSPGNHFCMSEERRARRKEMNYYHNMPIQADPEAYQQILDTVRTAADIPPLPAAPPPGSIH